MNKDGSEKKAGISLKERNKGLLMVCLGASMWGGSGVAGQYLLQDCGFSTEWLVVSRMLLADVIFLAADICLYKESIFCVWADRQDAKEILLFSILGMLAVQYTYFACIKEGNAAAAAVLQYLMPIIIVGYTAITVRRFPQYLEILCAAMAVGGTILLVTHGSSYLCLYYCIWHCGGLWLLLRQHKIHSASGSGDAGLSGTAGGHNLFHDVSGGQLWLDGCARNGPDSGHGVPAGPPEG